MPDAEARAVSSWVGGLPIALELLARSLDLGDLSVAELATLIRGAGVAQALEETQQVLRAAGAAAGMSPIVESLRISVPERDSHLQTLNHTAIVRRANAL